MTPTLKDWALWALAKGMWVFPCKPREKQPNGALAPHGVKDASNDVAQINRWWQCEPNSNYGVALGPSNITVLDIDTGLADLEAARRWFKRNQLPPTLTVRTGRRPGFGLQLYYRGAVPNKPYEHEGVSGEIRSGGYYVCGPGSIHPSGEAYAILAERSLAPVPGLIERLARKAIPRPTGATTEKVSPSNRHYYFIERARELHFTGLTGDGLVAALRWLYEHRCVRDAAKDTRVFNTDELAGVAQWVEEHPAEYPLQPRDFIVLRHAEKDELTQHAWVGNVSKFGGDGEEALAYLIRRLSALGCGQEQIQRIIAVSPLWSMTREEVPDYVKEITL